MQIAMTPIETKIGTADLWLAPAIPTMFPILKATIRIKLCLKKLKTSFLSRDHTRPVYRACVYPTLLLWTGSASDLRGEAPQPSLERDAHRKRTCRARLVNRSY